MTEDVTIEIGKVRMSLAPVKRLTDSMIFKVKSGVMENEFSFAIESVPDSGTDSKQPSGQYSMTVDKNSGELDQTMVIKEI